MPLWTFTFIFLFDIYNRVWSWHYGPHCIVQEIRSRKLITAEATMNPCFLFPSANAIPS